MGSFSQRLLFVSYLSNHIEEIFKTYSHRHVVGDGELWRSHNLQGENNAHCVPKILFQLVHYLEDFVYVCCFNSIVFCLLMIEIAEA